MNVIHVDNLIQKEKKLNSQIYRDIQKEKEKCLHSRKQLQV